MITSIHNYDEKGGKVSTDSNICRNCYGGYKYNWVCLIDY